MSTPRNDLRAPAAEAGCGRRRGFTLIEMMATLAVLAVLLAVALPGQVDFTARQRLALASQALVDDLRQAREDAVQKGQPVYVNISAGAQWCWVVSTDAHCDCMTVERTCALRRLDNSDFTGVTMAAATSTGFDPAHGRSTTAGAVARFHAGSIDRATQVIMHGAGRAHACVMGSPMGGLAAC